jgi:hypothetical protein
MNRILKVTICLLSVLLLALVMLRAVRLGVSIARAFSVESEGEFRSRLQAHDAIPQLTDWANERLPPQKWRRFTDEERTAIGVDDLRINHVFPVKSPGGETEYIVFEFGGGFRHYGLYIGPAGFVPERDWPYLHKWSDQVWFYDEVTRASAHDSD